MPFTLEVLPAAQGDCFLLHHGSDNKPSLTLIDAGPSGIYSRHLKPRLEAIHTLRDRNHDRPLRIDWAMVSHIDDDHIDGLLKMTKELRQELHNGGRKWIEIRNFWHNSFKDIIEGDPEDFLAVFNSHNQFASASGKLPEDALIELDPDKYDEETIHHSFHQLASVRQGAQLSLDIDFLKFPLNVEFDEELITASSLEVSIHDLKVTVIGPMQPEVDELRKKYVDWIKDLKKGGKQPSDVLAAYVDDSAANLSSLVLIVESGGKTILLTGDARGDKIIKGLQHVGLLDDSQPLHVDILKIPHHGSSRNLEGNFFERITADHYVFTGNGAHGNPERESFEMLQQVRPNGRYQIHLCYTLAQIDQKRQNDWEKGRKSDIRRHEKNSNAKIRPEWNDQAQSLTSFFDQHPNLKTGLKFVTPGQPHLITLH